MRAAQTTDTVAMDLNTVTTPLFQETHQHLNQRTLQQQWLHKTIAMMTLTAHLTSAAPIGAIVVTGQTTVVTDLLEPARVIQIVQTVPAARSGDSAVTGQTTATQMMHQSAAKPTWTVSTQCAVARMEPAYKTQISADKPQQLLPLIEESSFILSF